ncbi:MAG: YidC/Oxa1 family membrane protein insertase [Lachnospiraceae bacterium]|nr:YidC/Oxa1 family membrane protein insertase [Lachnospiraceae bacterium]
MKGMILTKYSGSIIGPVAVLLGFLMDGIFRLLNLIGIPNVGLSIILFTLVVYLCLLPLTIKQQKFSKLSSKMSPELQAINKKYQGKRDNESMMKMQEETKAVYAKYGVSQTGSCVQLVIQMPILFALYRVIYAMPAYVTQIKNTYLGLVTKLSDIDGVADVLKTFNGANYYSKQFSNDAFVKGSEYMQNTFIDVLNKASTANWATLAEKFPDLSGEITSVHEQISRYNNFLGLNIGDTPLETIKTSFESHNYLLVIGALLIPLISAFTQWLNTQLMPQQATQGAEDNPMMASMKTMNITMPIFSAFMCFTLPAGMGIYWIAGAVIRSIQMVIINKHFDKMDIDALIEENKKKYEESQKKLINDKKTSVTSATVKSKAAKNTKNIEFDYDAHSYEPKVIEEKASSDKKEKSKKSGTADNSNGSIAAKANKLKNKNIS